jgi:hypothetical protein
MNKLVKLTIIAGISIVLLAIYGIFHLIYALYQSDVERQQYLSSIKANLPIPEGNIKVSYGIDSYAETAYLWTVTLDTENSAEAKKVLNFYHDYFGKKYKSSYGYDGDLHVSCGQFQGIYGDIGFGSRKDDSLVSLSIYDPDNCGFKIQR